MTPRVGVVLFPGSNCEMDVIEAMRSLGGEAEILWHGDADVNGADAVVIPGGFAHGDYLRPGAIARFSPVMSAVARFAREGGPLLGICNGFQVLTEAGLLPGALQKNAGLRFVCAPVDVRVDADRSILTRGVGCGTVLRIPVNNFEGRYTVDASTLAQMQGDGQIVLRYVVNPNGSVDDIAGVSDSAGNVVGLMPHPERAISDMLGSSDGRVLLGAFLSATASAPA